MNNLWDINGGELYSLMRHNWILKHDKGRSGEKGGTKKDELKHEKYSWLMLEVVCQWMDLVSFTSISIVWMVLTMHKS